MSKFDGDGSSVGRASDCDSDCHGFDSHPSPQVRNIMSTWKRSSITSEQKELAKKYADDVISTIDYSDSNQTNLEKIKSDHYNGKVGEFAVYNFLERNKIESTYPDCEIYEAHNKSWVSDLYVTIEGCKYPLAVKTMHENAADKFGWSWIFQYSRTGRKDKVFENRDSSFVSFVKIFRHEIQDGILISRPLILSNFRFSDPIAQRLKGHKLVVYEKDNDILIN